MYYIYEKPLTTRHLKENLNSLTTPTTALCVQLLLNMLFDSQKKKKKSQEKKSVWGLFITSIGAIHPEIFSKRGVLLSSFQISWFQIVEHKIFKIELRLSPSSTLTTFHSHPWAPLDVSGVINMADFKDSEFLLDDTTSGWSWVQSKNKYAKQEKRLTLPNIRAYTTRLLITQLSLF